MANGSGPQGVVTDLEMAFVFADEAQHEMACSGIDESTDPGRQAHGRTGVGGLYRSHHGRR